VFSKYLNPFPFPLSGPFCFKAQHQKSGGSPYPSLSAAQCPSIGLLRRPLGPSPEVRSSRSGRSGGEDIGGVEEKTQQNYSATRSSNRAFYAKIFKWRGRASSRPHASHPMDDFRVSKILLNTRFAPDIYPCIFSSIYRI
jgi:hypothetical protein